MNIRPLADRVLIKPAAAEEKTLGGIIIPDSAKEKPLKGEIVAVARIDGVQQLGIETMELSVVVAPEFKTIGIEYPDRNGGSRFYFLWRYCKNACRANEQQGQ